MPLAPAITIRRTVVDVEVRGSEGDGRVVQRRMGEEAERIIAAAMETAWAGVDDAGQVIVLDRVEVHLEGAALDDLEAQLPEAMAVEVRRHRASRRPAPGDDRADPRAPDAGWARRDPVESRDEALDVFLRSGRLPWWGDSAELADLDAQAVASLDAWADGVDIPDRVPRWLRALAEPAARRRAVLQLASETVERVLRFLAPYVADAAADARTVALRSVVAGVSGAAVRRAVDARALDLAVAASGWDATVRPAAVGPTLAAVIVRDALREVSGVAELGGVAKEDAAPPSRGTTPGLDAGASEPGGDGVLRDRASETLAGEESGILVAHAGLVILHPFLPRLFASVGLLPDGETAGPHDRSLAVGLVEHLATGRRRVDEPTATVAKLLCGLPLGEPVEREPALSFAAYDEAEGLLRAVIGHWDALKGTSPDALRAEFLARPGLLTTDVDGGWLLRVEERTADILLDQLPWGVGMIRMPWMRRMLRVDWR